MKLKKLAAAAVAAAMAVSLTACGVNVTGVDLPENIELTVGETAKLDVGFLGDEGAAQDKLDEAGGKLELVWASSDEKVVTVTDGELKAVAVGEAEVTVSAKDGAITDVCKVVVTIPVEGVEVPETMELVLGEKDSAEIGAKLLPEGATGATLTYVSSDEKIATVDENGKVTAVGAGECVITTIGTIEKSNDTIKEEASTAGSEPVSQSGEEANEGLSSSTDASSTVSDSMKPAENSADTQTVTGETKVTVTEPEQSSDGNNNSGNAGNTSSNKNNGSTATGGSNTSGGNKGGATTIPPANNSGSNNGGGVTPPAQPSQPTQPDPAPAPAPTPAPQPEPEPQPPVTPPEAPPINDGTVIPGGGSDENNGGDATENVRPGM